MRLVLNEPGMSLGVKKGLLIVRKRGEKVLEIPPPEIDMVIVMTRGASISSAAVMLLARHGVDLVFHTPGGYPYSRLISIRRGAVGLRKAQMRMQQEDRGGELAKAFVMGKLHNQRSILLQAARNRARSDPRSANELKALAWEVKMHMEKVKALKGNCEAIRKELMRLEARAGEAYWRGFALLMPEDYAFPGRRKKFDEPKDEVNVSLNYGYGLLAGHVLIAIERAGLDPYMGFLHVDSPRRPALTMDLMEEFRQPVVDRAVLMALREGVRMEKGRLERASRLKVAKAVAERLNTRVSFAGRSVPMEYHILLQARRVAENVMGRRSYEPFVIR